MLFIAFVRPHPKSLEIQPGHPALRKISLWRVYYYQPQKLYWVCVTSATRRDELWLKSQAWHTEEPEETRWRYSSIRMSSVRCAAPFSSPGVKQVQEATHFNRRKNDAATTCGRIFHTQSHRHVEKASRKSSHRSNNQRFSEQTGCFIASF